MLLPSPVYPAFLVIVCFAFGAIFWSIGGAKPDDVWVVRPLALGLGLCGLYQICVVLRPNAFRLILSNDGIVRHGLLRVTSIAWSEIAAFRTGPGGLHIWTAEVGEMVWSSDRHGHPLLNGRRADHAIPCIFGYERLAFKELLEGYRRRALARETDQDGPAPLSEPHG